MKAKEEAEKVTCEVTWGTCRPGGDLEAFSNISSYQTSQPNLIIIAIFMSKLIHFPHYLTPLFCGIMSSFKWLSN